MGEPFDDLAMRGVQRLVLWLLAEARPVVREHHLTRQVAQAQPEDVVVPNGMLDESLEVGLFGRRDPVAQRPAVEDGLDGGLRHEACLGLSLRETTLACLGSVAGAEQKAKEDDGHQKDARVEGKETGQRSLSPTSPRHS